MMPPFTDSEHAADVRMQISLMRKLMHNNIVDYIGIGCTDKSSEASRRATMFLVSELLEGGTLKRLCMDQMMMPHRWVHHRP